MLKRLMYALFGWLLAVMPQLALASEAGGGYRGIATLYYMVITAILIYGVYDIFGGKVVRFAGPVIFVVMYLLIPDV